MPSPDSESLSNTPVSETWSINNQQGDPDLYPQSPEYYLPNPTDDWEENDVSAERHQQSQVRVFGAIVPQ